MDGDCFSAASRGGGEVSDDKMDTADIAEFLRRSRA